MGFWIQICAYVIVIPLQLLVIAAFIRGPYRRYPFVFAYFVGAFLAAAAEVPAEIYYYSSKGNARIAAYKLLDQVYWINEIILQVVVFTAVISLLYLATTALKSRRMVRIGLVCSALLFAGTSYLIHHGTGTFLTGWMTLWSRDLNVGAMVLDLALWALLLGARFKDSKLLLLSGSLGIMFAGDAISGSLRNMAAHYEKKSAMGQFLFITGDASSVLSSLTFLFLIWRTFRTEAPALKTIKPPHAERLHTDS
jgi:hypothetical protein